MRVVPAATCSHLMFHASIAGVARREKGYTNMHESECSEWWKKKPQNTIFKFREFMCRHHIAQRWFPPDFSRETFQTARHINRGIAGWCFLIQFFFCFPEFQARNGKMKKFERIVRFIFQNENMWIAFAQSEAFQILLHSDNFPIFNFLEIPFVAADDARSLGLIFQLLRNRWRLALWSAFCLCMKSDFYDYLRFHSIEFLIKMHCAKIIFSAIRCNQGFVNNLHVAIFGWLDLLFLFLTYTFFSETIHNRWSHGVTLRTCVDGPTIGASKEINSNFFYSQEKKFSRNSNFHRKFDPTMSNNLGFRASFLQAKRVSHKVSAQVPFAYWLRGMRRNNVRGYFYLCIITFFFFS